ncbi:hypothetical protein [Tritonibacter mobilis]|uniref:hypothetical protein n=1 Tax=Tritonibacter mobilis TaxID=379347 RepID=UPI000806ABF5|nr:hypothetical protein [Tritonibacter mobilis]
MDHDYFRDKLDDHGQRLSKAEVRIEGNEKDLGSFKGAIGKLILAVVSAGIIGLLTYFLKAGAA